MSQLLLSVFAVVAVSFAGFT